MILYNLFWRNLPYIPGTNTQLTNVFFQKYNFLGEKLETITPDNDIVASNSSGEYDIAVLPNDKLVITDMGQIDYSGNSPGGRFFASSLSIFDDDLTQLDYYEFNISQNSKNIQIDAIPSLPGFERSGFILLESYDHSWLANGPQSNITIRSYDADNFIFYNGQEISILNTNALANNWSGKEENYVQISTINDLSVGNNGEILVSWSLRNENNQGPYTNIITEMNLEEETSSFLRQFSVINVNDAPIISSSSIAFIQENNSLDDIVYRIIADDIDSNQLIYNIDGYDSDFLFIQVLMRGTWRRCIPNHFCFLSNF